MKIPYGNANFAEIRRKGMFYAEKRGQEIVDELLRRTDRA